MKKILLIGAGAREHAIARSLKRSKHAVGLFCYAPNRNPGIAKLCEEVTLGNLDDLDNILAFAKAKQINFCLIGPEAPLAAGVADKLELNDIPCIGPTKALAKIETSKGYARSLLEKYKIPVCPKYKNFQNTLEGVPAFLDELGDDFVIKADGLMGGKGVKVSGEHLADHQAALDYCRELQQMGADFVIEEKLIGVEFSLISFSDGLHLAHLPPVQDHKRALVDDLGPNTGGMGSYTCADHLLPFLSSADLEEAQQINEAVVEALKADTGIPYKGVLYGGFMATKHGIKVIEYNARFGDPEAVNLLGILSSDLVDICEAIINNELSQDLVQCVEQASVCKYAVPAGYPDQPVKNKPLSFTADANPKALYYASVDERDGEIVMLGSRAVAVLGIGDDVEEAEQLAEHYIKGIEGDVIHRPDIATKDLLNKYIKYNNQVRNTQYKLFS